MPGFRQPPRAALAVVVSLAWILALVFRIAEWFPWSTATLAVE
jgi:hypothetical protein